VISVFFVLSVGVELGFSGWVYAYAQELDIGGRNGAAWLTATFWGFFALGRLIGIPLAAVVPPRRMLFGACTLTVAAAALLVAAGGGQLVWVGTALLGIGLAPQFATMIAFAERHVAITGTATSWFIGAWRSVVRAAVVDRAAVRQDRFLGAADRRAVLGRGEPSVGRRRHGRWCRPRLAERGDTRCVGSILHRKGSDRAARGP
jgi:hypothetical protein